MANEISRASLLGLPTELRLKVYDHAIHTDTECVVLSDVVETRICENKGRHLNAVPVPNQDADSLRNIPLVSLQLTCKTIAAETMDWLATNRAHMEDDQNSTYVMDLDVYGLDDGSPQRQVTWRKLPCSPGTARMLVVNIAAHSAPTPWAGGGPISLNRALYQVLNHLCHNGPRIITGSQLKNHMHLKQLQINLHIGPYDLKPAGNRDSNCQMNYGHFKGAWEKLAICGLLFGYVDNIAILTDRGERDGFVTTRRDAPKVPPCWSGYGFDWGV